MLVAWFVILAFGELASARANGRSERSTDHRLTTNFGLTIIALIIGSAVPLAKVEAAGLATSLGAGVAPRLGLSWIGAFTAFLIVDSFAIYWLHRLMHATPLFWRVHRVHHADNLVDVSTSFRNHPLEQVLVVPASAAVILLMGAPVSAVIVAQTASVAATIWQHADIDVPPSLDRMLSLVVVTPRLHRLHHSPERRLHDSNYGELFTLWDRIFGTFSQDGGRRRVGLDGQAVPPDRFLAQIWSPRLAA